LDNALICPEPEHAAAKAKCIGGNVSARLLNYYYRKAA
jgi:hypothetical protein